MIWRVLRGGAALAIGAIVYSAVAEVAGSLRWGVRLLALGALLVILTLAERREEDEGDDERPIPASLVRLGGAVAVGAIALAALLIIQGATGSSSASLAALAGFVMVVVLGALLYARSWTDD